MPERMAIDVTRTKGEISPLWFGQNLEHTRSCLWQGLSGELIRNRKFAGLPRRDGAASGWYPVGDGRGWCLLEGPGGYNGTDGETYTAHFDAADGSGRGRQRIQCFEEGKSRGIGQRGIALVGGREVALRVALRADRAVSARVTLSGTEPRETRFDVGPGEWTEGRALLRAGETTDDARLEITFDAPGCLFVGAVSLLPADNVLGMRRDVIERLEEIGTPMLRWPGGNFAGDYHWQDGLLPVDRRAPLASTPETLPHTGGFDTHEIGTDEFIALCRLVGAEPFITINMSLEGPREAAAWVEYCNGPADSEWGRRRAERGHPEPYGVTYWTLGNEMGYDHMKGPNTPAAYAELARACARAMREVDPTVVLTVSTGWSKQWYEGVLAEGDDYYEHVSAHTYDRLLRDFDGEEGSREFRRLVTMPDNAFHGRGVVDGEQGGRRLTLPDIRSLIDARPGAAKPIGIAFDEWNVWYAWYREPGVAEGVYAAGMLNLFCREARNVGMTIGAYFEPVNEGAILVQPGSARLTPVGQVMALFKAHYGRQLLAIEPAPKGGDLDVAASLDERTGQVVVTLLNRSPDAGCDAEITVQGAAGLAVEEAVLLSSDDYVPGSVFQRGPLDVRNDGGVLSVSVPKHSVARVLLRPAGGR